MTRRPSKADKALDREIERLFYKHGQNVQIPIFDLAKISRAGREAAAAGADIEAAIIGAIAIYGRTN